jgi:hypothetical protein
MAISERIKSAGFLIHLNNERRHGWLVNPTDYDVRKPHPDLYLLETNVYNWEQEYLHEDARKMATPGQPFVRSVLTKLSSDLSSSSFYRSAPCH